MPVTGILPRSRLETVLLLRPLLPPVPTIGVVVAVAVAVRRRENDRYRHCRNASCRRRFRRRRRRCVPPVVAKTDRNNACVYRDPFSSFLFRVVSSFCGAAAVVVVYHRRDVVATSSRVQFHAAKRSSIRGSRTSIEMERWIDEREIGNLSPVRFCARRVMAMQFRQSCLRRRRYTMTTKTCGWRRRMNNHGWSRDLVSF
mmetsp:Transcript_35295/g.43209  ORF Transcript_35295/g.43209 Transcript_35295/m.43209 type:complete len:200 (+) Transcript_35295:1514-2113(+)